MMARDFVCPQRIIKVATDMMHEIMAAMPAEDHENVIYAIEELEALARVLPNILNLKGRPLTQPEW